MTSAFSWQNSIHPLPCFFPYSKVKFTCYSRQICIYFFPPLSNLPSGKHLFVLCLWPFLCFLCLPICFLFHTPSMHMCILSCFSCVQLCYPMDLAHQIPLAGILQARVAVPFSSDILDLVIEPASLIPATLAGMFFTTSTTWEAHSKYR